MVNQAHYARPTMLIREILAKNAPREMRRAGGEGGAAHRHRGRQQPAGAPDRAARGLKVRPDAISRAGVTEDPPGSAHVRPPCNEPMPSRAGDTAARGK